VGVGMSRPEIRKRPLLGRCMASRLFRGKTMAPVLCSSSCDIARMAGGRAGGDGFFYERWGGPRMRSRLAEDRSDRPASRAETLGFGAAPRTCHGRHQADGRLEGLLFSGGSLGPDSSFLDGRRRRSRRLAAVFFEPAHSCVVLFRNTSIAPTH